MADAQTTPPTTDDAQPFKELADRLGPKLEEVQERLEATNEQVKSFIKKNPGTVLLGAAALGFVIGRLASRR
jgi:ElaB/YqjD/DUF883 family membrane-anchored ribosome-binding protein